MSLRAILLVGRLILLGIVLTTSPALGQDRVAGDEHLRDRPIDVIRFDGVEAADEQLVRNNIRAAVGEPYDGDTVRGDVNRLYNLGRFRFVTAEALETPEGGVEVIYRFVVQTTIAAVETIGNRALSNEELRGVIRQGAGGPSDPYLIEKAQHDIEAIYRERGYYLTTVSIDEAALRDDGILRFRINEGPRVRIKAIEFSGAEAFSPKLLKGKVETKSHILILRPGVLDEDVLAADKASIDRFYKERGFIDVRVGHTIELSPDNKEAKVTFQIDEGQRYRLRDVRTLNVDDPDGPLRVFTPEQITALLAIQRGDVYSRDRIRKSEQIITEAYGLLGYLDARVVAREIRHPEPEVTLELAIREGEQFKVGLVRINGNFLTKDKVVRRLLKLRPGRPYDATAIRESERRISRSRLFGDVRLTVQPPDEDDPEERDLLVEVKERNTGSVNFGLAVGSDSGLFGEFSVNQTNFDIADTPESISELVSGRAFRGAGQQFAFTFRPGDEVFEYSTSLTEPHFLDTDYSLSGTGLVRRREFDSYDEERLRGSLRLSRRLGDVWRLGVSARYEEVELTDIERSAPVDIFNDAGPDTLTSVGFSLTRTTIRTFTRPGFGSQLELNVNAFGLMGGDFNFFNTDVEYTAFLTLDEDFLGRKTTLKLNTRVGYIFGDDRAPTYERFYLGGSSFRGFDFREVSPKGIRNDTGELGDDAVGGEWLFFAGAQLERPLFQETITGVVFMDSGTVIDEPGFDDYRISAGVGLRLYIAALGPVPIAFDFAWPITKEDTDETRVLSFSAELPF